ncbi:hypothetical protein RSSM_06022 [Rhodopirellula sallentina SM41]|uniref:Uncharacterized protein n=1 Tax=Rhodopirellula sallentina SM41 TaxID=1263870 RepID=M5U996_9BACT|nr:hypothetical protein RSSM_06022 [Rhodopirellula sallentina SM41]
MDFSASRSVDSDAIARAPSEPTLARLTKTVNTNVRRNANRCDMGSQLKWKKGSIRNEGDYSKM